MGAVGTEELCQILHGPLPAGARQAVPAQLTLFEGREEEEGENRTQSLSFLSFICMDFLDGFSCSDSTSVSPRCPECDCSLLIEEEGGCRHVLVVKWPLTFLLTCLNKYISKPVLFERAAHKD